jgi:hypothetical protein
MTSFLSLSGDTKNKYFQAYKAYLQDPVKNWTEMNKLIACPEAPQWSEELYELYCKYPPKDAYAITLKTNGSTNLVPTEYSYTYQSFLFKDAIWNFQHREYKPRGRYFVQIDQFSKNQEVSEVLTNEGKTFRFNPNVPITLDFTDSCWIFNPFGLHYLTFYPKVLEFMQDSGITVSVTEMDSSYYDWSVLKEYGIPLVNQMRSWKEGTAFYTCSHGTTHWMENLFCCTPEKGIIDLFNFKNTWHENPDFIWPLGSFEQCSCGVWYRPMNFQPHAVKWFYTKNGKPALFPRTTLDFLHLFERFQLIQEKTGCDFTIYVNESLTEKRLDGIRHFVEMVYGSSDFSLKTSKEEYLVGIRNKRPLFWSEVEYTDKGLGFQRM